MKVSMGTFDLVEPSSLALCLSIQDLCLVMGFQSPPCRIFECDVPFGGSHLSETIKSPLIVEADVRIPIL